jgi:uncharacterized protein (TIGR02145 family)
VIFSDPIHSFVMKKIIITAAALFLPAVYIQAQTVYAALAVDRSEGSYVAWAYDYATLQGAENRALRECKEKGGNCTVVLRWSGKGCGAYRTIDGKAGTAYGWGFADTQAEADIIATSEALKRSNGVQPGIYTWACNSVGVTKMIPTPLTPLPQPLNTEPPKKAETKVETKPEIKPETKAETKAEIKNTAEIKDKKPLPIVVDLGDTTTIGIAGMRWTAKNLDLGTFRNGDPVPLAKNDAEWLAATKAGQSISRYLNDNKDNGKTFGRLYNWYAVNDPRGLAPKGFHVPGSDEWEKMLSGLGDRATLAGRLKSKTGWREKDLPGTDQYGFDARPGGNAMSNGGFAGAGGIANFWCATARDERTAWCVSFFGHKQAFDRIDPYPKSVGQYVRCVKD